MAFEEAGLFECGLLQKMTKAALCISQRTLRYGNLLRWQRAKTKYRISLPTGDRGAHSRSFPVDFNVFLGAAIGYCNHDANTDGDRDSDCRPGCSYAGQDAQFPKRRQDAANQDKKADEIHACPFHLHSPQEIKTTKARRR